MPKIVDRDERRNEIISAYLGLVNEKGFDAVTTRVLTKHLGVSTGSLWNYFESQIELVEEAFRKTFEEQRQRLAKIADTNRGLSALSGFVLEVLPLTASGQDDARTMIEFWQKGPQFERQFSTVQAESEGEWASWARRFLHEAIEDGDVNPALDADLLADILVVLLDGLQMQYTMQTSFGSLEELDRVAVSAVSMWLTEQGRDHLSRIRSSQSRVLK